MNRQGTSGRRESSKANEGRGLTRLEDIPNVGPAIAADLRRLGIRSPAELLGRDPYAMYDDLCRITGQRRDPCLLDAFIAAVRFMEGEPKKPWWKYTAERKKVLAARQSGWSARLLAASLTLAVLLAVVKGFLQPVCQIATEVFDSLHAQKVNHAWVLLLGFLDATAFPSSAQHEDHIQPVARHAHGRKNGSDLEENSGLGRSYDDLPASQHQYNKAVVQLDNFWRLAIQKLLDSVLAAGSNASKSSLHPPRFAGSRL
jgi:Pathogenicity locus